MADSIARLPSQLRKMTGVKKFVLWTVGLTVVSIGALTILEKISPTPDDSANQEAAIHAIQQSYSPSAELISWNLDLTDASWSATKFPAPLCKDHGVDEDCYLVILRLDVIPNGDKKRLTFEWLAYAGNTRHEADNTEARTLFVSR